MIEENIGRSCSTRSINFYRWKFIFFLFLYSTTLSPSSTPITQHYNMYLSLKYLKWISEEYSLEKWNWQATTKIFWRKCSRSDTTMMGKLLKEALGTVQGWWCKLRVLSLKTFFSLLEFVVISTLRYEQLNRRGPVNFNEHDII